jgi:small-conductance mechanosensitive channel
MLPSSETMNRVRNWIIGIVLVGLAALAGVGIWVTRGSVQTAASGSAATAKDATPLVDQTPLQTARRLAALAFTADEKQIAQEALRLADQEVDVAFDDAIRQATEHPPQLSAAAQKLSQRLQQAEDAVKAEQQTVDRLTKELASAPERQQDSLSQQLALAKAELEVDEDELADAKGDLAREGGGTAAKLQRLLAEHEATQHEGDSVRPQAALSGSDYLAGTLGTQIRAWATQRDKLRQIATARRQSLEDAAALKSEHDNLAAHVEAETPKKKSQRQQATAQLQSAASGEDARQAARNALASLKQLASDQKTLAALDRRVENHTDLAANYAAWASLLASYQRATVHDMLKSALWILLILLAVYLVNRAVDHYLSDPESGRRRLVTLRAVIRFATQFLGLLAVLFLIFGVPSQIGTIIGLAGAGLTVALKDFIVGFFGWFVLMGRNGIHVGDWVEINGVAGEVVEIGLLKTVLMETGNWTDTGHPTGRKVSFVNSFAIEGHFFNFSTAGQWLWDELQVLVPSSENPYPLVEAIQKMVLDETKADARMAEEEWQKAAGRNRVRLFTADPAISLRTTALGLEIRVRYVTRAHLRYALRTKLYEKVVGLMHGRPEPVTQTTKS